MRLDSALKKKSSPIYLDPKKLDTFDVLDEREIARSFPGARAFMAMPVSF
jgi:hypothetical protein